MSEWFANNAVTIVAIAVLAVLIAVAVRSLVKDKKNKTCCTGNCATCGMGCCCGKGKSVS